MSLSLMSLFCFDPFLFCCSLIRRSYQQLCDARSADRVAAKKAKKAAEAEKDKAVAAAK